VAPAEDVACTLTVPGTVTVGGVFAGQFTSTLYESGIDSVPPPARLPLAVMPTLYVPVAMPAGTESEIEVEALGLALVQGVGSVSVPPVAVIPAAAASALGAPVSVTTAPPAKCGVLPPPWKETVALPVKAWATPHAVTETLGPDVRVSPSATS